MKAHYEIIQGSSDWLKIKWGKLGGTLSKGLFIKSDTLLDELLSQINEDFEIEDDSYESDDMIRGAEREPIARLELSKYIGVELLECGWLQCEEIPLLGISPDGISKDEKITAEIKCPARKKHTTTIRTDEIPSDNINQCVHYFTVNPKLERHFFCSFRPENKLKPLFVKELTRDSAVNLGTKANPKIKTVREWVELAKNEAKLLLTQIDEANEKLSF